jgi:tRNA-splicing ligase RtcB
MRIIGTEKLPIKIWAAEIDETDGAIEQARNLANHPIARKWICLMPDYHVGYGMPIGGVLATAVGARGGVIPNAVGVDIGCGMIAARTHFEVERMTRDVLQDLRVAVHARVPVGMKHHDRPRMLDDELLERGRDLHVVGAELGRAQVQVGTLGSGNHFIEIQRDAEDRVWVMLHSGSRNVGLRVCNHYHGVAKDYMKQFHSEIPHIDLAFLPEQTPEYGAYLDEMRWCMAFAEANRRMMFDAVCASFEEVLGEAPAVDLRFDTHHNFAQIENHFGEDVLIHRKGAVEANGLVTIPGSMGTASFIGEGLEPMESFRTCSHGAGRLLGRKAANKAISHEQAFESMQHVVYSVRQGEYDEMPACYKDIDAVMEAQSDLVSPVHRLLPMAVVKG